MSDSAHISQGSTSVEVARCPEHGLHGDRHECFVCGGPVERVPMVEECTYDAINQLRVGAEQEVRDLIGEREAALDETERLRRFVLWVVDFTKNEPPFSGGRQVHDRAKEALSV